MGDVPKVPGYLVDAPLGDGSEPRLWAGRVATSLDRVALLRIDPRDIADLAGVRAEVQRLSTLRHPNLVAVRELVPGTRAAFVVYEWIAGRSLADLIAEFGRLGQAEVVAATAPIADALAYLHGLGLVHGGVAADRILITDDGQPTLAGIAEQRLLRAGGRTVSNIDPAMASGAPASPPSDVFMLAAVALYALTATPLWRGDTPEAVLLTALTSDLSDVAGRLEAGGVGEQLREVLRAALALDRRARPSAGQLALQLRECAPGAAIALPQRTPAASQTRPAPDRRESLPPSREAKVRAATTASMGTVDRLGGPGAEGPPVAFADDPPPLVLPERARPGGGHRHPSRRPGWLAAAAVASVLLIGGGVAWAVASSRPHTHQPPQAASSAPAATVPVPSVDGAVESLSSVVESLASVEADPSDQPSPAGPSGPLTVSQVATVLVQLDALREGAYADRAPLLLTGVYATGALLDEDTASLQRIVPTGCGLEGVHTAYTDISILAQSATTVQLSADATLMPSVLFCNGVAKAKAPGSGPTMLQITLIRSGSKFLISSITS